MFVHVRLENENNDSFERLCCSHFEVLGCLAFWRLVSGEVTLGAAAVLEICPWRTAVNLDFSHGWKTGLSLSRSSCAAFRRSDSVCLVTCDRQGAPDPHLNRPCFLMCGFPSWPDHECFHEDRVHHARSLVPPLLSQVPRGRFTGWYCCQILSSPRKLPEASRLSKRKGPGCGREPQGPLAAPPTGRQQQPPPSHSAFCRMLLPLRRALPCAPPWRAPAPSPCL